MKKDTKLAHTGRAARTNGGGVNPAVEHASTLLFETVADLRHGGRNYGYGRYGSEVHRKFEECVCELEGGVETRLAPSGLAAVNAALIAFVEAGDHILVTDSAYDPVRSFCDRFLGRFGVTTEYYDPLIGEGLRDLMRPETKLVLAESPGSLTFEVQDLPALAKAAHAGGARLIVDNTWSAGYFLQPLALGADVSVQAGTKYLVGHADAMIGTLTSADAECAKAIRTALQQLGSYVAPDEVYLALRGVRTLSVRLRQHERNALEIAHWLEDRPEVDRVLHPALPGCPGHEIWKRDFSGSCGLFSALLKPAPEAAVAAMLDGMDLFGMGFSWGGYESLAIPSNPALCRTATKWPADGPLIRFHIGLEDTADLIA
ncbi:MAG: cystathionine beta-lyase, partial [Pseudomonadota bacterium]